MNVSYDSIGPELLKRLYVDERSTAAEIAARVGCAPITILRRLRRFGIPTRPRGPSHQAKTLNGDTKWSPNLAYAVGLIATDGNLSGDGRLARPHRPHTGEEPDTPPPCDTGHRVCGLRTRLHRW